MEVILVFLTDDLEAAVGVELPDVARAEPALAAVVHEEVQAVPGLVLVVAHGDVGPPDQDLPTRVGLV